MLNRCLNRKCKFFRHYGGRGITVCDRWRVFENFLADMGIRPLGMTLDRVDNDGNYEPTNCRWATPVVQSRNSRMNRNFTIDGVTQCLTLWLRHFGISHQAFRYRTKRGLSEIEALTTPVLQGSPLLER